MKKAQVQAITLVLISGVVIALVGTAYLWGKPLIEKRSTITQFTSAVRFMEDLNDNIIDMARSCTTPGACEQSMRIPVSGIIKVNSTENSITYEFPITQPLLTQDVTPLNTGDIGEVAEYGETPGVITFVGNKLGEGFVLTFTLHYRQLYNSEQGKGYKLKLLGDNSGTNEIMFSYEGSSVESGQALPSGDLILSKVKIQAI